MVRITPRLTPRERAVVRNLVAREAVLVRKLPNPLVTEEERMDTYYALVDAVVTRRAQARGEMLVHSPETGRLIARVN